MKLRLSEDRRSLAGEPALESIGETREARCAEAGDLLVVSRLYHLFSSFPESRAFPLAKYGVLGVRLTINPTAKSGKCRYRGPLETSRRLWNLFSTPDFVFSTHSFCSFVYGLSSQSPLLSTGSC